MMNAPVWGLALAYWLHMLSTVVWIGGLSTLVLWVLPAARQALDAERYAAFLESLQRRLDPLGWFCLVMLVGTGMFQMSASPNYQGFLAIGDTWSGAILIKHGLFLGMVAVSAILTWGLLPALRRNTLRLAQHKRRAGQPGQMVDDTLAALSAETLRLQRQNDRLLRVNLLLSVLVLALTALARVS